jgi:hypothetical protein
MKLIKVIDQRDLLISQINDLMQFGFTLVYSEGMIKIYREV